jgi:hypothetical protein
MTCPECHLENPASSESCDCGYSFVSNQKLHRMFGTGNGNRSEWKAFWVLAIIGVLGVIIIWMLIRETLDKNALLINKLTGST